MFRIIKLKNKESHLIDQLTLSRGRCIKIIRNTQKGLKNAKNQLNKIKKKTAKRN